MTIPFILMHMVTGVHCCRPIYPLLAVVPFFVSLYIFIPSLHVSLSLYSLTVIEAESDETTIVPGNTAVLLVENRFYCLQVTSLPLYIYIYIKQIPTAIIHFCKERTECLYM